MFHRYLCLLAFALCSPTIVQAQRITSFAVPPVTADSIAIASEPIRRVPHAMASSSGRQHHAGIGAVTGAAIGAVAGIIGSTFLHTGCMREPCHETRTRIGFAVWFGGLGAMAGAIVGGVVGAVVPASSATDSSTAQRLPSER